MDRRAEAQAGALAERMAWEYPSVTVVRPSWIYGPRDRVTLPRIIPALQQGRVPIIGSGNNLLNIIYVTDVADGETDNAEAHVSHVAGGHFLHFGGEGVPVLVNLFHGHGAQDRAQVAFQRLHGDVLDFVGAFAEELFGRGRDGDIVTFHFDLRDAIDFHRHAFAGVNFGRLDVDGEQFE